MNGLYVVNSEDRQWTRHRYVLWFGACAPVHLMVWGNSLESALEVCGAWLAEHTPGLIITHDSKELRDLVDESARELGIDAEIPCDYRAQDHATADLTYTEAGYIASWEWGIDFEDPTRDQLKTFEAFARASGWCVR